MSAEMRYWSRPGCGGTRDENWKVDPSTATKIDRDYYGGLFRTRLSTEEDGILE